MRVPAWLTLSCAAMVLLWGFYRIKLGLRSAAAEEKALQKKGLFGLPRRTHILMGIVYVVLGGSLVAITFGWNPLPGLGDGWGGTAPTETPAETKGGIEVPR